MKDPGYMNSMPQEAKFQHRLYVWGITFKKSYKRKIHFNIDSNGETFKKSINNGNAINYIVFIIIVINRFNLLQIKAPGCMRLKLGYVWFKSSEINI